MIVEVRDIKKSYGRKSVLTGINFKIEKNQFISVIGASGCGKSTFLNIVGLVENPSSGEVFYDGRKISQFKETEKSNFINKNIGFIFQSFFLLEKDSVYSNIELPLLIARVKKKERQSKVVEVSKKLRIEHLLKEKVYYLSGGEKQRVAIARALVMKPSLIIADEPCGNLDDENGRNIIELLSSLAKQEDIAVLMVTHNALHSSNSDEVYQIKNGILERVINDDDI